MLTNIRRLEALHETILDAQKQWSSEEHDNPGLIPLRMADSESEHSASLSRSQGVPHIIIAGGMHGSRFSVPYALRAALKPVRGHTEEASISQPLLVQVPDEYGAIDPRMRTIAHKYGVPVVELSTDSAKKVLLLGVEYAKELGSSVVCFSTAQVRTVPGWAQRMAARLTDNKNVHKSGALECAPLIQLETIAALGLVEYMALRPKHRTLGNMALYIDGRGNMETAIDEAIPGDMRLNPIGEGEMIVGLAKNGVPINDVVGLDVVGVNIRA